MEFGIRLNFWSCRGTTGRGAILAWFLRQY